MHIYNIKLEKYSNKYFFIMLFLISFIISLKFYLFFIFTFIYLIYLVKNKIFNYKIFIFIFILISIFLIHRFTLLDNNSVFNGTVVVIQKEEKYIVVREKFKKYIIYDTKYNLGDKLNIEGEIKKYKNVGYTDEFDTKYYLISNYYSGIISIKKSEIIKNIFVFNKIKKGILDFYKDKVSSNYYQLFSYLTLSDNTFLDNQLDVFSNFNIMHVLAISGFHLGIIFIFLNKLLYKITKRTYLSENIVFVILFLYVLLCSLSIGLLRSYILLLFYSLNKRRINPLSKLDCFSLSFIFIFIVFPLKIYSLSFIFSSLGSFIVLFIHEFVKVKNFILKEIYTSIIFFLVLLPFYLKINNEISLLSFLQFLIIPFFTYIFIPFSYLVFLIPKISIILGLIYNFMFNNLNILANLFVIKIMSMSNVIKCIYYFLLYILLKNKSMFNKFKKMKYIFGFFLLIFTLYPYISIEYIAFVDVNQGDTTLIKTKGKYYLIDCYNITNYLDKKGIKNIESIFITHSDFDHYSDLENVYKKYNVKKIYINCYDDESLFYKYNYYMLQKGDKVKIGNINIDILSPSYDYMDKNSNSLVLYFKFLNKKFLLMADATIKTEEDIINSCDIANIDYLKVGHHGSKTSSSKEFLDKVNPKNMIVSVGLYNRYDLPNDEIINKLKKYGNVYLTSISGTITVYYFCLFKYRFF